MTQLLGSVNGWVPTTAVAALLLLAADGTMQSKLDVMFWLLDRCARADQGMQDKRRSNEKIVVAFLWHRPGQASSRTIMSSQHRSCIGDYKCVDRSVVTLAEYTSVTVLSSQSAPAEQVLSAHGLTALAETWMA